MKKTPLHGTKTHPLTVKAKQALRDLGALENRELKYPVGTYVWVWREGFWFRGFIFDRPNNVHARVRVDLPKLAVGFYVAGDGGLDLRPPAGLTTLLVAVTGNKVSAVKPQMDILARGDPLPRRWAHDWDRCQGCGTSERKHSSGGLCERCRARRREKAARHVEAG